MKIGIDPGHGGVIRELLAQGAKGKRCYFICRPFGVRNVKRTRL